MHIIENNPYRIIGLLVGSTAREQERQIKKLKQYIEAEQDIEDDYSFPELGELNRTIETVMEAASKLHLNSDKINAAIFWFYNGNDITDEAAFDAIKEGNSDLAIDIWKRLTYDPLYGSYSEVTKKNASAFHNLSSYYLGKYDIDADTIQLKLLYLESDFFIDLKNKATDEIYKISKKEIQLLFLNSLLEEGLFDIEELTKAISNVDFVAKDEFLKIFVKKPIEQLEILLKECKTSRKSKREDVIKAGTKLYETSIPLLNQISGMIGDSDLKYTSISDKISDEILQCGIQLFNDYKDHNTYNPSDSAMDLLLKAKSLAIGNIVKQRCFENIENLQDWIDEKPVRDKQAKIIEEYNKLKNVLDDYDGQNDTIANAKLLLSRTKTYLNNIKYILGSTDELYLGISSRIASDAQRMCVSEINKLQEKLANENLSRTYIINSLKEKVNEAWDVTITIGSMDLQQDFRARYSKNKTSLFNLKTQLAGINTGGGGSGSSGGNGCYIATMAYGDFDHPQVIILRQFRDDVLDKSVVGKWLIKTYYYYSPKLVEKLKNKRNINTIIRKTLNQFIKLIK